MTTVQQIEDALTSVKNLMKTNLVNRGVTTIQSTDNLLTLADRILEVSNAGPKITYILEDSASTDSLTNYEASQPMRNSGTSTITFDSTNKYYSLNNKKNSSMSFIPIVALNGKEPNFTVEFDSYFTQASSNVSTGFVVWQSASNWSSQYANDMNVYYWGTMLNGTLSRQNLSYTPPIGAWMHNKYILNNTNFSITLSDDSNNVIFNNVSTLDSSFANTTNNKYGFPNLWAAVSYYIKNIKIY